MTRSPPWTSPVQYGTNTRFALLKLEGSACGSRIDPGKKSAFSAWNMASSKWRSNAVFSTQVS